MIPGNKKTSLLIDSQLPGFVKDDPDYSNFVLFLEAYYEWLEQNNNITKRSKSLLSYKDIDTTTNEFMDYYFATTPSDEHMKAYKIEIYFKKEDNYTNYYTYYVVCSFNDKSLRYYSINMSRGKMLV